MLQLAAQQLVSSLLNAEIETAFSLLKGLSIDFDSVFLSFIHNSNIQLAISTLHDPSKPCFIYNLYKCSLLVPYELNQDTILQLSTFLAQQYYPYDALFLLEKLPDFTQAIKNRISCHLQLDDISVAQSLVTTQELCDHYNQTIKKTTWIKTYTTYLKLIPKTKYPLELKNTMIQCCLSHNKYETAWSIYESIPDPNFHTLRSIINIIKKAIHLNPLGWEARLIPINYLIKRFWTVYTKAKHYPCIIPQMIYILQHSSDSHIKLKRLYKECIQKSRTQDMTGTCIEEFFLTAFIQLDQRDYALTCYEHIKSQIQSRYTWKKLYDYFKRDSELIKRVMEDLLIYHVDVSCEDDIEPFDPIFPVVENNCVEDISRDEAMMVLEGWAIRILDY